MSNVYDEIRAEREYQDDKWGVEIDDTKNTPWMWAAYIGQYATSWMRGTFLPLQPDVTDAFRKAMVKVAAIAVAAIQSIDRQRAGGSQSTFYERPFSGYSYEEAREHFAEDKSNAE
ncbi:MAG: hypothetical protein ACTHJR_11655 [Sphingomonas sp.]